MMKQLYGLLALLTLSMVVLTSGCDKREIVPPPIPDRSYGPPFGKILYVSNDGALATQDTSSDEVYYVNGTGSNTIHSESNFFAPLWQPIASPNRALILVDNGEGEVGVFDENGLFDPLEVTAVPYLANWNYSGVRAGYYALREFEVDVISRGLRDDLSLRAIYATFSLNSTAVRDIISYGYQRNKMVVNLEHLTDPDSSSINVVYADGEGTDTSTFVDAIALQLVPFDNHPNRILYLDASGGVENAYMLIITDEWFRPRKQINLLEYDIPPGITAFEFSDNANQIAFYADVYGGNPQLYVMPTNWIFEEVAPEIEHIELSMPIVVGEGDQLKWAKPSWDRDSANLVVLCDAGDGTYSVVAVNLGVNPENRETVVADSLTRIFRPDWMKYAGL